MIRLFRRARALLVLCSIFIYDLIGASLAVARIVLVPSVANAPAIVVIPVALRTEWATLMFAYFTSLTPGSTCVHVPDDCTRLYVHMLDAPSDVEAVRRFKALYERWLLELER